MSGNFPKIQNWIGGKFQDAVTGESLPVFQPATGREITTCPDSGARDLEIALNAAESAFPSWSKVSLDQRSKILRKIANGIEQNLDHLALAESRDTGKPLQLARSLDIPRAAANFHFFADAITQLETSFHTGNLNTINYTLREPLGIVGTISPWNLPLYLLTWKIAPALAAGNCVISKPSEMTPMTAFLLSQIVAESGLPAGVLGILHGRGSQIGSLISENPKIRAITFTGSTATGRLIAQSAAKDFKKISLEMGGKNPTIIFADAVESEHDLDRLASQVVRSSFLNQGQICLCGARILVEKNIYDRFKSKFVEKVRDLKIGDPEDPDTQQGALVSREHLIKIESAVARAKAESGKILAGGSRPKLKGDLANGYFYEPTVLEGLAPKSDTEQNEIFGPVVTLTPFKSESEALELANGTPYGLAASLYTQNLNRAHQMATNLDFGIVWLNSWLERDLRTPFGGMKNSGLGREGGKEALQFFTEAKNVCLKLKN